MILVTTYLDACQTGFVSVCVGICFCFPGSNISLEGAYLPTDAYYHLIKKISYVYKYLFVPSSTDS